MNGKQPPDPPVWQLHQRSRQLFMLTVDNRLAMDFDFLPALHFLPDSKRLELAEKLAAVVQEFATRYRQERAEQKRGRRRRV